MKPLLVACRSILSQLEDVIERIHDGDFTKPSAALSQATIGQHLRHTIEFFICLENGFKAGRVNYDKRNHDHLIERDKVIAVECLRRIGNFISHCNEDKVLKLEVAYEKDSEDWVTIDTNFRRELVYNIEHTVHHMAIMKIGIREVAPYVQVPADFGIAVSTLRYKNNADRVGVSVE